MRCLFARIGWLFPEKAFEFLQNSIQIFKNTGTGEVNELQSVSCQKFFPSAVICLLIFMMRAVDFHNRALLCAIEIRNVRSHRNLSSEFQIAELLVMQLKPEALLSFGFIASETS